MTRASLATVYPGLIGGARSDRFIAICVLIALMAVAVRVQLPTIPKAWLSEIFLLVPSIKAELATEYAIHGTWPTRLPDLEKRLPLDMSDRFKVVDVQLVDGSFNLVLEIMDEQGRLINKLAFPSRTLSLSFRRTEGAATHVWLCGYERPLDGALAPTLPNVTTVPPELLPPICRDR